MTTRTRRIGFDVQLRHKMSEYAITHEGEPLPAWKVLGVVAFGFWSTLTWKPDRSFAIFDVRLPFGGGLFTWTCRPGRKPRWRRFRPGPS